MVKRYLILEDGTVFEGGLAPGRCFGEVVNTAMTGYQEITNPIYTTDRDVTQPNVGNSDLNVYESIEPPIGVIVRNLANIPHKKAVTG